jgi:hypothetical protein
MNATEHASSPPPPLPEGPEGEGASDCGSKGPRLEKISRWKNSSLQDGVTELTEFVLDASVALAWYFRDSGDAYFVLEQMPGCFSFILVTQ